MQVILFGGPRQLEQNRQGDFTASVPQGAAQATGDMRQLGQGCQRRSAAATTLDAERAAALCQARLSRAAAAGRATAARALLWRSARR